MFSDLTDLLEPSTLIVKYNNANKTAPSFSTPPMSPKTVLELENDNQNHLQLQSPSLQEEDGEESEQAQPQSKGFPIVKVPMEILDIVLEYCDARTLANLQASCRSMRCVIRPTLWNEVHIEFDGDGKERSPTCLAPPTFKYRHKSPWYMNINIKNMDKFIQCIKDNESIYLFWTRHLMIKSPVDLEETISATNSKKPHEQAEWLLTNLSEYLTALDSLDIWGLTQEWYGSFKGLFDRFNSSNKSLHWVSSPVADDCVMISNLKAMTLHGDIMENLNYAFDLEEFNFFSTKPQSTRKLYNALNTCSQLKRVSIHIPGLIGDEEDQEGAVGQELDWLPTYVTEYEQFFEQAYKMPSSSTKSLVKHGGIKFLRSTIPSGRLTQDVVFPTLERLSIYSGGAVEVCDDLFSDCTSIKELVLEDIPLSLIIQTTGPLGQLQSLICRGGVLDGVHDSPKVLPKQLNYLIIKPNWRDTMSELTTRSAEYIRDSNNLKVFVDVDQPLDHPEWHMVKGSMVSDGFAHYIGNFLYQHV